MTDLETRLRDSLHRAADDAPRATGLAARVRARRRPRPTAPVWAGAVVAAVAVVIVAVVPRLVGPDAPGASDDRFSASEGWKTLTYAAYSGDGEMAIDVPSDWVQLGMDDCDFFFTVGPPGTDPCVESAVIPYDTDLTRPGGSVGSVRSGQGSWVGLARSGEDGIQVAVDSEEVARRVLASFRPADGPDVDLNGWRTETVADEYGEVTALVPDDPRVEVRLAEGLPDCDTGRTPAEPDGDGAWTASLCRDRIVTVTAPTQALTDVVAATVRGY